MESTEVFKNLEEALRERVRVIADAELRERDPAAQLQALRAVSSRITRLHAQLPPDIDSHLAHYLQKCSYDKALTFLEGRASG